MSAQLCHANGCNDHVEQCINGSGDIPKLAVLGKPREMKPLTMSENGGAFTPQLHSRACGRRRRAKAPEGRGGEANKRGGRPTGGGATHNGAPGANADRSKKGRGANRRGGQGGGGGGEGGMRAEPETPLSERCSVDHADWKYEATSVARDAEQLVAIERGNALGRTSWYLS